MPRSLAPLLAVWLVLHPSIAPTRADSCSGDPLTSQAGIDAHAEGYRFCGGRVSSRIRLRRGQSWVGGAVGPVSGLTQQTGALELSGENELIDVSVHHSSWAGIYLRGNGIRIVGGRITDSAHLGIGGGRSSDVLIDGTEIARNGSEGSCGFEAGGLKWVGDRVTVRRSWIHDNDCKGLWADIEASDALIEDNVVERNGHEGIFVEISRRAIIRRNLVSENGHRTNGTGCSWLWGGGITIPSSEGVEIYANRLRGNCNGITGTKQARDDPRGSKHPLDRLHVHDNLVRGPGRSGVVADDGTSLRALDIRFERNAWEDGHRFCGFDC